MQIQANPFLPWQLISALLAIWMLFYVKSSTRKIPVSNPLVWLLLAGSTWSLLNAIQYLSPDPSWQTFWHSVSYLAIVVIPTSWFILVIRFTEVLKALVEKYQAWLLIVPTLTAVAVLTNTQHNLFFITNTSVVNNGFSYLTFSPGPLFLIHAWYSYALVLLGVLFLVIALFRNFKVYGMKAPALILGATIPSISNYLHAAGAFPSGFPDPTPTLFTITCTIVTWVMVSWDRDGKDQPASREDLDTILDSLKDYYFETDLGGYVVNINKAFYQHLGYSCKEDLIGKNLRHFTDQKSVRDIYMNFRKVIDARETVELFRYTYHTRDGREFIGETTVSPIMEGGQVVGARGVLRNITEKLMVEESLRQAKEEAENRIRELSAINRIAITSSNSLELDQILQTLCKELTSIFPVRNAGIGLTNENVDILQIVAFHSTDPFESGHLGRKIELATSSSTQEAVQKKKAVISRNYSRNVETGQKELINREIPSELMIVPLVTRGSVIGTIGLPANNPDHSFNEYEIRLAETIAIQIAAAIDNANLYAKTETALDHAQQDLEIGRQIQAGFFPEEFPDVPGWEIAAHFEAARQVSGDFYDFFKFDNSNLIAMVIADVCDKGVGAALFMVLFRSLLRAFGKLDVSSENAGQQLKTIITNTNNYIAAIHGRSNMFATMFFGILDPDDGKLFYVNGGHLPPAIMDKDGKLVRRLPPTGPAVGLFLDVEYQVEQVDFQNGDFLVAFTDGTTDAQNDIGGQFSEDRLLNYIQVPWSSLFSMMVELKNELHLYKQGVPQFDDITLISIRRKLTSAREKHAICRVTDSRALKDLVDFVDGSAAQCKLDPREGHALKMAVEGALGTILLKGFDAEKPGVLSLVFESDPEETRIIIRDDGRFVASLSEIPPSHPPFGQIDRISYGRMDGNGNQLILEKKHPRQLKEDDGGWNHIQVK